MLILKEITRPGAVFSLFSQNLDIISRQIFPYTHHVAYYCKQDWFLVIRRSKANRITHGAYPCINGEVGPEAARCQFTENGTTSRVGRWLQEHREYILVVHIKSHYFNFVHRIKYHIAHHNPKHENWAYHSAEFTVKSYFPHHLQANECCNKITVIWTLYYVCCIHFTSNEYSHHKGQGRGAMMFSLICVWKRLSKQSGGWWFEIPSRPLWRHRNAVTQNHNKAQ